MTSKSGQVAEEIATLVTNRSQDTVALGRTKESSARSFSNRSSYEPAVQI
jgi:hypothetical protein